MYIDIDSAMNLESVVRIRIAGDRYEFLEEDLGFTKLVIEIVPHSVTGNLYRAYTRLASDFARYSVRTLRSYIAEPVEYLLLLLNTGDGVIMEGFETKVVYPSKQRILFAAHTHPRGPAVFSRRDILSALDLLSKRGLASCVIGYDGELCIYRKLLLDEEDYEELLALANDVGHLDLQILTELRLHTVGFIKI